MKNYFFSLFFLFLVAACNKETAPVNFEIISPQAGARFYSDDLIVLSADGNTTDLQWYSDLDGFLGRGESKVVTLSTGEHKISLRSESEELYLDILIIDHLFRNTLTLDAGDETSETWSNVSIYNLEESSASFTPTAHPMASLFSHSVNCPYHNKKDPLIVSPDQVKRMKRDDSFRPAFSVMDSEKNTINLNLLDLSNRGLSLLTNTSFIKLFEKENQYLVYFDQNDISNASTVSNWWESQGLRAYTDVLGLLGKGVDVDNNSKIVIAISSRLNQQGLALGYFYSADLYSEDEYNPFSNEKDILYLGMPVENDNLFHFQSISATLVHEYTHWVIHSKKTWQKGLVETVNFDEGMAHFIEHLLGYGVSGGNEKFVQRYLENTADTSFLDEGFWGMDSAEKRGAYSLFFSFLYWNYGEADFLNEWMSVNDVSWSAIAKVIENDRKVLLLKFFRSLLNYTDWQDPIYHSLTGEDIVLRPDFISGTNIITGPKPKTFTESSTLSPFSMLAMTHDSVLTLFEGQVVIDINEN